jgi:formylmethanofuran dehydrogenase subunit B
MANTFSDVTCTVCGCACDDLQVTVENDCVKHVQRACHLAQQWFAALSKPSARPIAAIEGRPVPLAQAIERSAGILANSRAPLIFGLSRSSTAGQRAAIALAEQLGATIDTPASCQPAPTLAFQKLGQSTCSLGEVSNRADLVIFWRADPLTSHPRHLERYSVEPRGMFVPRGRDDRNVVVVDTHITDTSKQADTFIQVAEADELRMIEMLRALVLGGEPPTKAETDESSRRQLTQLAEQMKTCHYGALFFGAGQGDAANILTVIESLLQLTRELNQFTRFTAHYIPASGGLTGAENVLCWQTGFPFAVNFAGGYPRFSPDEFAANKLLERGEVDACILVGSDAVTKLSKKAAEHLAHLPTIALDNPVETPAFTATIQFTTAIYGIHAPGTAYRMDGVPIPLRAIMSSPYPTDDHVLTAIAEQLAMITMTKQPASQVL